MLLVSISVGVMSGLFISLFRLKLGMPGHKAFFWMTPVLIARLLGKCKVGTTAGGFFAALTAYSMGANLAGGVIGMPIIILAGIMLDCVVNFAEKKRISGGRMIVLLGLAGMVGNLVCLAKRVILPTGISPHFILGVSGLWFRVLSYAFFGLLSGVVASASVHLAKRKSRNSSKS
ncbi:MAG: hypothetical protein ACYS8Z_13615 [Planctomycetota bacterium]|jgi:hypothetical protein